MAVEKRKQRETGNKVPYPAGKTVNGYKFKRDDSKVSAKQPNGTCYICTSPKHMERDCPHFGQWDKLQNANLIEVDLDPEAEALDEQEYLAMLVESKASAGLVWQYDKSEASTSSGVGKTQDALRPEDEAAPELPEWAREISENFTDISTDYETGGEIVDAQHMGAAAPYIRYPMQGYNRNRRRTEGHKPFSLSLKGKGTFKESEPLSSHKERSVQFTESPLTTTEDRFKVHQVRRMKQLPDGLASLGTRALHVRATVGSSSAEPIRGRLDFGVDIILRSEEFWASIPGLPKPTEGIRMKLYHFTGQAKILGYVKTTLYLTTTDGELVSFKLEAYVVRNMRVPLLLGEDFQMSYELGVTREVSGKCEVQIGKSNLVIPASSSHTVY
ncbi:hypothetical protein GGX14DRAFT_577640 [Mycena pura]|uniref:Uncharacterized protein n=1 Tax=Mycena pura TaxID=153505 RepID=A0AAD6UR15_9AGAR|nr:hypothetical protein GGX14DRAFT_577640 [Mycena pura]